MNRAEYNRERDDLFCKFCGKSCKNNNSLTQHQVRCKQNPNHIVQKPTYGYKGKVGWSRGLTKETDIRISNMVDGLKKYYESHDGTFKNKKHSDEVKELLHKNAIEKNFQQHFGTRKSYLYRGYTFISSYEVNVARELDTYNIKWEKPGRFPYIDLNGIEHTYTPDFYLPDYDIYLDPKNDFLIENINPTMGYTDIQKIKWVEQQNNINVIILNKNQLDWDSIKNMIDLKLEVG